MHRMAIFGFGLLVPIAALLFLIMPMAFHSRPRHTFFMMGFAFSPLVYIALYIVSVVATKRARASEASYPTVMAWALLPSLGVVWFIIRFTRLP
jgi:hypothetical protein